MDPRGNRASHAFLVMKLLECADSNMGARIIDIFVRDRSGHLIPGVSIKFAIDGRPAGEVNGSEGRGRIELPETNKKPVAVTVSYRGEDKTSKIAYGQDSFEFRYDVDIGPTKHIALWSGIGLIILAVVLAFYYKDPNPLQTKIIQGLFSVGLGGVATELTGFLNVDMKFGTRLVIGAGGALAVFIVLWFTNAKL
jgi:hypothetical protein